MEKQNYTKANLVERMSQIADISKAEAERQLTNTLEGLKSIIAEMKPNDRIQLVREFTVSVVRTTERVGRNPRTKEEVIIPAKNKVVIKAGCDFQSKVQQ